MVDEEYLTEAEKAKQDELAKVSSIKKIIDRDESFFNSIYNRCKNDQKILNGIDGSQFTDADKTSRGDSRAEFQFPLLDKFVEQILGNYNSSPYGIEYSALRPELKDKARLLSMIVKGIESRSNAKDVYRTGLRNIAGVGYGYVHCLTKYANEEDESLDVDVRLEAIADYTSVLPDSLSVAVDGSDMNHISWVDYISIKEAGDAYGKDVIDEEGSMFDSQLHQHSQGNVVPVVVHYEKIKKRKTIHILPDGSVSEEAAEGSREKQQTKTFVRMTKIVGNKIVQETDMEGIRDLPIVPIYGLPVFSDGKVQRVGITHRAKDSQRLVNYSGSLTAERLALSPKANYIAPMSAIGPFKELWKQSAKATIPFLPYIDFDVETQRQIAPPTKQDTSVNIGDVVASMQIQMDTMEKVIGMPQEGIAGNGNVGETAEAAILKAKASETILSTFYENLSSSIKQVGRVVAQMVSAYYDTPRAVPIVADGSAAIEQIDFPSLGLIPNEFEVSVSSGPLLATQRKDNARQLLGVAQIAGPAGLGLLPKILQNIDIDDEDKYLEQWAANVAKQSLNDNSQEFQQLQQQVQGMTQENEALKMQVNELNQELIEARMSLEKEQIKSQTDIIKAQMSNQNKLQVEQMKIEGDVALQTQKGMQEREQAILENQAELKKMIAEEELELINLQNQYTF